MQPENEQASVARQHLSERFSKIEVWLEQARNGSPEALGLLLDGCRKYLLVTASRSLDSDLRPRTAPSDLVQETFIEVHRCFSSFAGRTEGELLAWLTTILKNRLANNIRRHRDTLRRSVNREIPYELTAPDELIQAQEEDTPSDVLIGSEQQRQLQLALERLSERDRMVLQLRTWERQSFAKIGAHLGISSEAARKIWGRAVHRLEAELRETS